MTGVVFWDFDRTLGERDPKWPDCVLEALDEVDLAHGLTVEAIAPHLRDGFPWHDHGRPHPELSDPDAWWASLTETFSRALVAAGYPDVRAPDVAAHVREKYLNLSCWRLYDDVLSGLEELTAAGWRHVVISNHVPELPEIMASLGLSGHIESVFSSARVGFEKPHPALFRHALEIVGYPACRWMVGDNVAADVEGAERVGIPAILLERDERRAAVPPHTRVARNMQDVIALVGSPAEAR